MFPINSSKRCSSALWPAKYNLSTEISTKITKRKPTYTHACMCTHAHASFYECDSLTPHACASTHTHIHARTGARTHTHTHTHQECSHKKNSPAKGCKNISPE